MVTVAVTAALAAASLASAGVLAAASGDGGAAAFAATAPDPTDPPFPTSSPSPTPSPSPTASPSPSPMPTPSPTASPSPSPSPTPRPSPSPSFRGVVRSGTHGRHEVALTFDDGFSTATIRRIGEILIREKVPATFFVIGRIAAQDAAVIRPLAQAGFPFGSHTYDHGILTRPWLSVAAISKDMLRGSTAVERVTGVPTVPFVRPPGGYVNAKVIQAAKDAGYRAVVLWAVDSADTRLRDPGAITWAAERGWNGSIVIMHMNRPTSADILPAIIASYKARGYRFVTLGQMFGVPGPVPSFGPTPKPSPRPSPTPSPSPTAPPTPSPSPSPAPSASPILRPTPTPSPAPTPAIAMAVGRGR